MKSKLPFFILATSIAALCPAATNPTFDSINGIGMTSGTNTFTMTRGTTVLNITAPGTIGAGSAAFAGTSSFAPSTGSASIVTLGNVTSGTINCVLGNISGANLTGIAPAVGALTGAGTGITTALGINTGSAGSIVINGGAGGTPSSLTLTNATGLPNSGLSNSSLTVNGTSIALGASGTVTASANTLTTGTLASGVTLSSLTSTGVVSTGTWSGSFGSVSGANLTGITVAGSALTGTTLASGIVTSSLTSTGVVSTGTWSGSFGAVSGANLTGLAPANIAAGTVSVALTSSAAGAASTSALRFTGTPFAGTGTTSFPLVFIGDSTATASTTLQSAGTYFGINGHGSSMRLIDAFVDGASKFSVTPNGVVTATSGSFNGASYGLDATIRHITTTGSCNIATVTNMGGTLTIADAKDIAVGSTTGTKIGTATSQKIGFWNATAITQPTRAGQLTDNSGGTSGGATIAAIADGSILDGTQNAGKASTANAVATLAARINLIEGKLSAAGGGSGMTASLEPRNVLDAGGIFALLWCAIRARRKQT